MIKIFFEILQLAIGNKKELTHLLKPEEWVSLYHTCEKQSLLGISFAGITRLPKEQRPPMQIFAQWIYDAENIKDKNAKTTAECEKVSKQLSQDGFWNCILKGQGNLVNYPEWLCDYRTCGDIDIWAAPARGNGNGTRQVIEYAIKTAQQAGCDIPEVRYNHVELPHVWDVDVEIHHRPSYLFSPFRNHKLQRWFENNKYNNIEAHINNNDFPIPESSFNAIYQLIHVHNHLFDEGIGLRQILDYYYVLKALHKDHGKEKDKEIMQTLDSFGMQKFASAMMYVLQTVFAMPNEYLLCKPNEKEGEFLLNEIMMAGNFGKYDKRIARGSKSFMGFKVSSGLVHAWEKSKHNLRLLNHYPEEVMWEPIFRFYHFIWRRFELWKW